LTGHAICLGNGSKIAAFILCYSGSTKSDYFCTLGYAGLGNKDLQSGVSMGKRCGK